MKNLNQKPFVSPLQEEFGAKFGNAEVILGRPDYMKSDSPAEDKRLFREWRNMQRNQQQFIKQHSR